MHQQGAQRSYRILTDAVRHRELFESDVEGLPGTIKVRLDLMRPLFLTDLSQSVPGAQDRSDFEQSINLGHFQCGDVTCRMDISDRPNRPNPSISSCPSPNFSSKRLEINVQYLGTEMEGGDSKSSTTPPLPKRNSELTEILIQHAKVTTRCSKIYSRL